MGNQIGWHFRRRDWLVTDLVLSAAAISLAYLLQPQFSFTWLTPIPTQPGPFQASLVYASLMLLCMHIAGLHDPLGDRSNWWAFLRTAMAVTAALGFSMIIFYFSSLQQIGRSIILRTFIFSVTLQAGARLVIWRISSVTPRRIGCILDSMAKLRLDRLIEHSCATVPLEKIDLDEKLLSAEPAVVAEFFNSLAVLEVVVTGTRTEHQVLWLACLNRGIQVTDVSVFVEREYYRVPCDDIDLRWFLVIDPKWNQPVYKRLKRVIDIMGAGLGLFLSLPLLVLSAVCIWWEDRGPVLYRQSRVGFRGELYSIWKLRTMKIDAELTGGAQWAKKADSRVTRIGRVLRITRIDELPQFWNVLHGEMSLIGPRPERPEFVEHLAKEIPLYPQRHWIKAGITGWAQINYPYGASIEDAREKLCYDLYYLKNASLLLDVHIALRTLGVMMKGSR